MAYVYIGLGSNLGDCQKNIKTAKDRILDLKEILVSKESSIEETDPVDFVNQPKFLNQVILIKTAILPEDLLVQLKNIEDKMGRKRTISKGPRIIDLDILLYDDLIFDSEDLKIPHPEITNREFILKHLVELSPGLLDPVTKIKYSEIYEKFRSQQC